MANDTRQAAVNAIALLKQFTSREGSESCPRFDHKGFLDEMEARAALEGRKLTAGEQRSLARMVRVYCDQYGVQ